MERRRNKRCLAKSTRHRKGCVDATWDFTTAQSWEGGGSGPCGRGGETRPHGAGAGAAVESSKGKSTDRGNEVEDEESKREKNSKRSVLRLKGWVVGPGHELHAACRVGTVYAEDSQASSQGTARLLCASAECGAASAADEG